MSSLETRAGDLAHRMPHVPKAVVAAMQAHLRERGKFPERGMPAVLEAFFARLEGVGLPPEHVTEDIFRDVGTSRSRFRCLIAALRQFAPTVPLAASTPVKQEWDRWLNERYNTKVPVARASTRVGLPPEAWPEAWASALPALDRTVRPYGERLRKLGAKTRQAVVSSVGLLARSREWAEDRGVGLPVEPSEDLFIGYLHYLQEERDVSFGTARDYLERARMFFLRAGLFDETGYAAVSELIGALNAEATDEDPGKWFRLRAFRQSLSLADVLHIAVSSADIAMAMPGNSTAAFKMQQKAIIYALLVNTGDRQGDLRELRIGIELVRDESGDWRHGIRQNKTGNTKEIDVLWPGTSALIDRHILGDRPDWLIADRLEEVYGLNLLTLSTHVVHKGYINARLSGDFGVHGHLVRTMIADLIRRARPDALWALQQMLGHTDQTTQNVYRSDFDESQAVKDFDALYETLAEG